MSTAVTGTFGGGAEPVTGANATQIPLGPFLAGHSAPFVAADGGAERLRDVLAPHADEFAKAAEESDDPAAADANAILAALASGDDPPRSVARSVRDRAEGEQ